jgi:hypothetical protein
MPESMWDAGRAPCHAWCTSASRWVRSIQKSTARKFVGVALFVVFCTGILLWSSEVVAEVEMAGPSNQSTSSGTSSPLVWTSSTETVLPLNRRKTAAPASLARLDSAGVDIVCTPWNCSCQRLSDLENMWHSLYLVGSASNQQQAWWTNQSCTTDPKQTRLPRTSLTGRRRQPTEMKAKEVADICYFVLMGNTPSEWQAWDSFRFTWPQLASNKVYRVLGNTAPDAAGGLARPVSGQEAINGSGRVDHAQGVVQLQLDESYDTLPIKTLALFRYLSRSFESGRWNMSCGWFVKVDLDTWLNVPLLEARLNRLSPDLPVYTGYLSKLQGGLFCQGGFYLVSRDVVRAIDGWIDPYLPHLSANNRRRDVPKWFPPPGEDQHFGRMCINNGVIPQMLALPNTFAWSKNAQARPIAFDRFASLDNEHQLCTQAAHPIKNVTHLHTMHQRWETLRRSLPEYYNRTVLGELCFAQSINYAAIVAATLYKSVPTGTLRPYLGSADYVLTMMGRMRSV